MPNPEEKSFLQSVGGKVVAAFLIGAIAVALAWVVLRVGFKEILVTVDRLSAPNEKLRIVNDLFHNITRLDQLQKTYAIRNPDKPAGIFKQESRHLLQTIDTLRQLSHDPAQVQRLDSMEAILHNRNQLFDSYFKLKADFLQNEALARRIRAVARVLANRRPEVDSSIIRTNRKITTTTIFNEPRTAAKKKPRQSFFSRLFGARKAAGLPPALKKVEEELKVQVDTLSVAKQDNAIWKVQKIMRRIEGEQHRRTNHLLARELALVNAESRLHHQLLGILHAIEAEEINLVKNNNALATTVVNASIRRINVIILVTALVAALLIFLIFIDISRSNKYRRQLIAAKEEAEYLGQVKQRFLANMSHEIRTPLQSIIGFAEQVRHQKKPDPEFLEAIYQSSDHLLQIVNEVLDYSRIVSDTFTFEQKPFVMQQLVAEVVETMKPLAARKHLALVLKSQLPAHTMLTGDPFRLRQILFNLLGNAIKFTERGQVRLEITAAEADGKTHFCIAVQDTGIGIPAAELDRIFKVFEQVDGAGRGTSAGTGLGLSIVKTLVESQGGSIEVSSEPGRGSSFTVRLAFAKAVAAGPADHAVVLPDRSLPFKGGILVVDDDAFIVQLCRAIFRKHHIRNTCTTDPRQVLEEEWDEGLQLVLLDIRMPGMNGLELCRALRSRVPASCRIIALTAQALPEERAAILAQGFDGLLMKPFREQELLALIGSGVPSGALKTAPVVNAQKTDFSALIRMTGGEEAVLRAVLHQFMAETQQDLEQLQRCLQEPVWAALPEAVVAVLHRLAGRTGQIGAKNLSARLRAVEVALLDPQQTLDAWLGEIAVLQQEVKALKGEVNYKLLELQAA
jgi:signal transduction histidine kinase/DNA-binding response OmpR family regulator/CHASE3 domain sensor protein